MRRVRLRRVGLRSIFLLFLVLYGGVGLLVGIGLYVLSSAGVTDSVGMTALDRLGPWSMALFPLIYGVVGGIAGTVGAALYNAAAAVTGGIRLDLEGGTAVEVEAPGDAADRAADETGEDGDGGGEAAGRDREGA